MKHCIPGELWNQIDVPTANTTQTNVGTYLSEVAYKLPSATDVMVVKEFWHSACELCERCGALLMKSEKSNITSSDNKISVGTLTPSNYRFQRFVGASYDGNRVGFDKIGVSDDGGSFSVSFNGASSSAKSGFVEYSVVPDIYSSPDNQTLPLWFIRKYERMLIAGTLMRLHAMDGEQWTDATAARMDATTYMREINRITHGLITAGMRKQMLFDAESILARQSQTTNTTTNTNTVG